MTQSLKELRPHLDLCCWDPEDAAELIQAAATAAKFKMPRLSVPAAATASVWSWLEKSQVKLSALVAWNSAKMGIGDLAREISAPLKRGADAVQLYVRFRDLKTLSENLREIKGEIFFDKHLSIALGLDDVPYNGWIDVFLALAELRADNLMLISKNIKTLAAMYYNLLDNLPGNAEWGLEVCSATDDAKAMEDIYRMTEKMTPAILPNLRLIVRNEFMKNYPGAKDEDL